jgi:hypothetical protein
MGFIQVIEFTTTDLAEFDAALSEWTASTSGTRTATRGTLTADRDRPNTYVQIVEFPSYDAAMANSDDPNTTGCVRRDPCSGTSTSSASPTCSAEPTRQGIDHGSNGRGLSELPERGRLHTGHQRRA